MHITYTIRHLVVTLAGDVGRLDDHFLGDQNPAKAV